MSKNPPWPAAVGPGVTDLRAVLAGFAATERDDPARIAAGQRAQFAWLWSWIRRQVPWYARPEYPATDFAALVDDPARFAAAWAAIPLLAKSTLRQDERLLVPRAMPSAHQPITSVQTSGSVGIPVTVRKSWAARLVWDAGTIREHLWQRREFGKRLGVIRYLKKEQRRPGGAVQPTWGQPVSRITATGPSGAIHIAYPVAELAEFLTRFDPHYVLTYPSVALALLDLLGPGGKPAALEQLRLMSEPVDRTLRERLAAEWGVTVADIYSANEVGYIALECEAGSLHLQSESLLVEILDDQLQACGPGATGRVVITDLHNLGTPLVRYDIGDYATVGDPCRCGRTLPVLREVRGRVRNLARTPDGRTFWPVALGGVRRVGAVVQAQFVQTALDGIELRVVLSRPLVEGDERTLQEATRKALGYPYRVDVVPLPAIPRGPTGKFEEFLSLLD
jgi:phenylacetate-CoA ligase